MLDLESLISILEACNKNKIAELVVRKDAVEVRTVAAAGSMAAAAVQPQVSIPAATEVKVAEEAPAAKEAPAAPAKSSSGIELTAPTPGVAYVHPGTTIDRKPLPKVGDVVEAGQVVALVEAMKMFNEVTAPRKSKITDIKVVNESLVKIGDIIMVLEPL